jgi:hypothetical protein
MDLKTLLPAGLGPAGPGQEIIEYCENGINPVVKEQYYLDLLKPEYNILEQAGYSLGFKHNAGTLEFFNIYRKVSEETKQNLSIAAKGRILTEEDRKKYLMDVKVLTFQKKHVLKYQQQLLHLEVYQL